MGILANHVPSIEQLKPGLIEVIEESGGSKQFFRMSLLNLWVFHGCGKPINAFCTEATGIIKC